MSALFSCPACGRTFEEAGFCPFDRSALARSNANEPTLHTSTPTIPASHKTFPLTPSAPSTPAPAPVPVHKPTAAESVVAMPAQMRMVSASGASEADALAALRQGHRSGDEYDKLVGQTLDGRYYVQQKLGEGGMGVVFAARHAVIERPLAIKVLKREVMRDAGTIQRFVREAKAASRIGHPNIVDVTDFGTTPDGMTFSVMEFVSGHTLGATIRSHAPFPPERVIRVAAQIARALGAAHDKGIVHRDLKPENIFLSEREGRTDFVKIVDFGIAKMVATATQPGPNEPRLTRAGSVFGTPEYMAPEQAAGKSDTDGRVDIYALGVIMYEMLCARVPHRGDSTVRTLAMQMLDPIEPPSKVRPDILIPADLEAVVMKALAKKRDQRYQTMHELVTALERVLTLVGKSLTGSPIYALAPLPPGADPSLLPAALIVGAPRAATPLTDRPTQRPKSRTKRHEPEFTTGDKPPTFEHVWTESDLDAPRRRWPLIVLPLLALAGVGGAVALVAMRDKDERRLPPDAGVVVLTPTYDDAAPSPADAAPPADAEAPPADAEAPVHIPGPGPGPGPGPELVRDAGVRNPPPVRRDGGSDTPSNHVVRTPNGRGTFTIQVLTKPEGATLYDGTSYQGPGGTTIEAYAGEKKTVRCHLTGYKDGFVELAFDGKHEVAICELKRVKLCIEGIKNPIDDCEPAPN